MSVKNKHKSSHKKESLRDVYEEDLKNKDKGSGNRPNYLDTSDCDLDFYKIKKDKNKIRIVPFPITTDNHPSGREKGKTDYKLELFVHRRFGESEGDYICMKETYGKPCPGCKELKKMIESKEYSWKDDAVKDMRPKRRDIFVIQDLMEEGQMYLFDVSQFEFLKEVLEEAERDEDGFVPFADPDDGKAIIFYGMERQGKEFKGSFKPDAFKFKDDEPLDEDVLEAAPSLDAMLIIPNYEDMEKDLYGISGKDNDDEDESPKRKRSSDDDDDDSPDDDDDRDTDDDDDDDNSEGSQDDDDDTPKKKSRKLDDDDDEEEHPKKGPVRKSKKPADDDDDEEEEKPKKKSGKKCPHGYKFGEDCDEHKECKKCKLFDDCADAY